MNPLMKRNRDEQSTLNRWVPIILMALLITTVVQMLARTRLSNSLHSEMNQLGISRAAPDTLVVYIFSYTNPEYKENLLHFVRHGIREDDGCQYVIVIQTEEGAAVVRVTAAVTTLYPYQSCPAAPVHEAARGPLQRAL